jgi:hypothetical protein
MAIPVTSCCWSFGEFRLASGSFVFGLRAVQFRAIGPRVNGEKDRAFLDLLSLFEVNLLQVTVDPRTDFDSFRRLQASRKFVPFDDFTLKWRNN